MSKMLRNPIFSASLRSHRRIWSEFSRFDTGKHIFLFSPAAARTRLIEKRKSRSPGDPASQYMIFCWDAFQHIQDSSRVAGPAGRIAHLNQLLSLPMVLLLVVFFHRAHSGAVRIVKLMGFYVQDIILLFLFRIV